MTIRLGGFDAGEGEEDIWRCHCGWDVHASTQWKATGRTSLPSQHIIAEDQRERQLMNASESGSL